MAKTKFSLSKFLISNWFVTLFSTMFGIIAGLYISDYFEKQQLKSEQQNAFEKIIQEVENNEELLKEFDSISRALFEKSSYVFSKMNEEKELFIHKDSVEVFKKKSKGIISNIEFRPSKSDVNQLQVNGDAELNINSKLALLTLNDVVWSSYKQTNYMTITNFNCITNLEELYKFQLKCNTTNGNWLELFFDRDFLDNPEKLSKFMMSWEETLFINRILLNFYDNKNTLLSDCY